MATLHELKTHPEYVEGCFGCKVSSLQIGYCGKAGQDATAQKRWDAELDLFKRATANGVMPDSTKRRDVQKALDWSDRTGKAYSEETKLEHDKTRYLERVV